MKILAIYALTAALLFAGAQFILAGIFKVRDQMVPVAAFVVLAKSGVLAGQEIKHRVGSGFRRVNFKIDRVHAALLNVGDGCPNPADPFLDWPVFKNVRRVIAAAVLMGIGRNTARLPEGRRILA